MRGARYPIDADNAAEMARLTRQARLISSAMGLLPACLMTPKRSQRVLDLACGPGQWVIALSQMHPDWEI